jgi:Ca2+-binding EF-hand superfamily protein
MTTISSSIATSWASNLFSKLDTRNQGYLDQADLESAFSAISGSTSDVGSLFSQLDGDSNGKVTEDEMTTALQSIFDQLDSQLNEMRMHGQGPDGAGGPNGMPPPPPPPAGGDAGFTKEELASQLEEIGTTDSQRAGLISKIIENFDAADSDGDGRVSFDEAMAYDQSTQDSAPATASGEAASTTAAASMQDSEARLLMQLMQLMQAYQVFDSGQDATSSLLSTVA